MCQAIQGHGLPTPIKTPTTNKHPGGSLHPPHTPPTSFSTPQRVSPTNDPRAGSPTRAVLRLIGSRRHQARAASGRARHQTHSAPSRSERRAVSTRSRDGFSAPCFGALTWCSWFTSPVPALGPRHGQATRVAEYKAHAPATHAGAPGQCITRAAQGVCEHTDLLSPLPSSSSTDSVCVGHHHTA